MGIWLFLIVFLIAGSPGYIKISEDIDVAVNEQQGNEDVRFLMDTLYDLTRLRQLLLSTQGWKEDMEEIRRLSGKIVADIESYRNIPGISKVMGGSQWQDYKWKEAFRALTKDPGPRHDQAVTRIIDDIQALIVEASNSSRLILDPRHDSYYLMDICAIVMPELAEVISNVGRLLQDEDNAASAGAISNRAEILFLQKERLGYLTAEKIPASFRLSGYGNGKSRDPAYHEELEESINALLDSSRRLLLRVSEGSKVRGGASTDEMVRDLIEKAQEVSWKASAGLESLLLGRAETLKTMRLRSGAWALLLSIGVVFCFYMVLKSSRDAEIIRDQSHLLDMAFKATQDGIWQENFVTGEFYISPRMLAMFGYGSENDAGSREVFGRIFDKKDLECIHDVLQRAQGGEEINFHNVMSGRHKDGLQRQVFCRLISEKDPAGRAIRVVGAVTDVTNLEQARLHADNANVAKKAFLENITCEIMAPINGIIGMSEIMQSMPLDKKQRHFLGIISSSAASLFSIMNDVIDFSRHERGAMGSASVPFDLKALCQQVAGLVQEKAQRKGLSFAMIYDENCDRFYIGDPHKTQQVILKLCDNAVKFTNAGYIRFSVSHVRRTVGYAVVRFSVEDSGIGISEEARRHIFTEFSQGDDKGKNRCNGMGIGLPLCRKLLRLMGSEMEVRSAPNNGSEFNFELLLGTVDFEPERPDTSWVLASPLTECRQFKDIRALIADSDFASQEILKEMLALHGIDADTASDGHEAILNFDRNDYDLVFTAHQMPKVKGADVIRYIRKGSKSANARLFSISLGSLDEEEKLMMEAGADDYLRIPMHRAELAALLSKWLPAEVKA